MTRSQIQRIAAATLVALIALVACSLLGLWQYSRAHRDDIAKQVLAAAVVPVQSLETPGDYVPENRFARKVSMEGPLLLDDALLSCGRHEHGVDGCWVIAPVHVTTKLASVLVLGFAPTAAADAALADLRGKGTPMAFFDGRLQPAEIMDRGHAVLKPATQVPYINVNELAIRWDTDLFDGYVVATGAPQGLQTLTSPLILPPSGITWRNLFYAWQWWTFAAFVLFLLFRYIVDVRGEPRTIATPAIEEQQ